MQGGGVNTVEVRGLKELRRALLDTVPKHFQGKVLQKALTAAAKPIVKTARGLAPVKTGVLRRAIYAVRDKFSSDGIREQRVITVRSGKRFQKTSRDAFYWRWLEFGRGIVHAGSRVRMRRGESRNYRTDAVVLGTPTKGFFGKEVKAVQPRPFLRPAFDRHKGDAVTEMAKSLEKEIPEAARKAKWRTPSR